MDKRKHMGKDKDGVIFPVAPNLSEMGDSYLQFIEEIKKEILKQRVSIVMNANTSMICLYWNIGRAILEKQQKEEARFLRSLLELDGTTRINAELAEGLIESMYLYGDGRLEINFGFKGAVEHE